jgi:hypothetical protein
MKIDLTADACALATLSCQITKLECDRLSALSCGKSAIYLNKKIEDCKADQAALQLRHNQLFEAIQAGE